MKDERKKIVIPLGRRKRKKKKIYCKRCKWRTDRYSCHTYKIVNDHISRRHRVRFHTFEQDIQNENNDCQFFAWSFWSIFN